MLAAKGLEEPDSRPLAAIATRALGNGGRSWFTGTVACSGLDNQGSDPSRLFGRKTLRVGLAEVVAALGTGCSVIFPSLMIGIDQSIVSERRKTVGELIEGMLLYGSEHF